MRVGVPRAGLPSRDPVSEVLRLSFAIEFGRLLTRSGESGSSGDVLLAGNSNAVGGSIVVVIYTRLGVVGVIARRAACCMFVYCVCVCDVVLILFGA